MKSGNLFIVFIILFAIISATSAIVLDLTISNSYQRAIAAGFIADFAKHGLWHAHSFGEIKDAFINGHEHYKLFSGLADWQPLQLMLLTVAFFLFGISKFGMIIVPLAVSVLALVYLYRLVLAMYDHKTALAAAIITGISTFFFYESAAPLLENGIALFSIACIYYSGNYLNRNDPCSFYLAALSLGLGFLYHLQMMFILPALAIMFLAKVDLKKFFTTKQNYRMIAIALGIFLLVMIPFILREIVLVPEGISTFESRMATRIKYFSAADAHLPGFVTAYDFEFENELPIAKRNLIINRYQINYLQKGAMVFSSLFFHWILVPFILLGILCFRKSKQQKWWNSFNTHEGLSLFFVITTILVFTFQGLLPRYLLPASIFLFIFAARGIFTLPKKAIVPAIVLVLLVIGAQTGHFLYKISQNDHIQSMQHDYDGTAQYMLEHTPGEFTVITTRVYQMAFSALKKDESRRMYIEMAPFVKAQFLAMLDGNFSTPPTIEGNERVSYSTTRPKVAYVVVHERLETGALRDIADYNLLDLLNNYPNATLVQTLDSRFPNSRTWIYAIS
ncbi:MAG TPA: glycosyltransferase family 39 protein [Candidatus Nanoarchaeia archaeon]|nr:glycosyltransferase family 39 protein [Candidatus Nanoarchaeia archaeon]